MRAHTSRYTHNKTYKYIFCMRPASSLVQQDPTHRRHAPPPLCSTLLCTAVLQVAYAYQNPYRRIRGNNITIACSNHSNHAGCGVQATYPMAACVWQLLLTPLTVVALEWDAGPTVQLQYPTGHVIEEVPAAQPAVQQTHISSSGCCAAEVTAPPCFRHLTCSRHKRKTKLCQTQRHPQQIAITHCTQPHTCVPAPPTCRV